jgi:hypothetical protein
MIGLAASYASTGEHDAAIVSIPCYLSGQLLRLDPT